MRPWRLPLPTIFFLGNIWRNSCSPVKTLPWLHLPGRFPTCFTACHACAPVLHGNPPIHTHFSTSTVSHHAGALDPGTVCPLRAVHTVPSAVCPQLCRLRSSNAAGQLKIVSNYRHLFQTFRSQNTYIKGSSQTFGEIPTGGHTVSSDSGEGASTFGRLNKGVSKEG